MQIRRFTEYQNLRSLQRADFLVLQVLFVLLVVSGFCFEILWHEGTESAR